MPAATTRWCRGVVTSGRQCAVWSSIQFHAPYRRLVLTRRRAQQPGPGSFVEAYHDGPDAVKAARNQVLVGGRAGRTAV